SGPNGSGKSVLMKHLNGLLTPTSGEIVLDGENILHDIKKTRQKIGLVFQDADSQIVGQTVEKDTAFGPENLKLDRDEITSRVENALKDVSLLDKRKFRPHILSGGEKRRLAIAGVLAMNSPVLIFDEPFSNLDYPGVKNVLSQIVELHKKGHTIIVITHDLGKVLAHGKKLIIMKNGKIEHMGTPDELIEKLESCGIRKPESDKIENMTWLK
ncbi:MAG: ATP-binding cassette domain-containing protein, partial [Spirochaetaceae bacterium]|nr:ATP-binding cassette domain-containing protein [Spirochaetaceae bacterium]